MFVFFSNWYEGNQTRAKFIECRDLLGECATEENMRKYGTLEGTVNFLDGYHYGVCVGVDDGE